MPIAADSDAPYRACLDEPAIDGEPETWNIWDNTSCQIHGSLNNPEATRMAACFNFCQNLTTDQLEEKGRRR